MEILVSMGYNVAGTPGTAEFYNQQGFKLTTLLKPCDQSLQTPAAPVTAAAAVPVTTARGKKSSSTATAATTSAAVVTNNAADRSAIKWIESKVVDLVINIPEGTTRRDEVTSGYLIRRAAVDFGVGLLTNIK